MNYYNKISRGYDELYKEEQSNKLKIIKGIIKLKEKEKLLDVGCGTGVSSDFNCFVVGIDLSIELLKINKNKNKIKGVGEFLPFKDDSFDIVISITSLHNFRDIKKGIDEIKRVGKNKFVFSILKKSEKFELMKNLIYSRFVINKQVEEEKDIIFFASKKHKYN